MSLSYLIDRLHAWGRWCRHDGDSLRSCIASFWAKWIPGKAWDSGWGTPDDVPAGEDHTLDAEDAERIDAYIQQLPSWHRIALIRRYVHQHRAHTHYERQALRAATEALATMMGENTRTVRHIRLVVRGKA